MGAELCGEFRKLIVVDGAGGVVPGKGIVRLFEDPRY